MLRRRPVIFGMALIVCTALILAFIRGGEGERSAAADIETTSQKVYKSVLEASTVSEVQSMPPDWNLPGMEALVENEYLMLYFHPDTTEIAIRDKRDGSVWYSNPANRSEDKLASAFNKAKLGAQITLTYYNSAGQVFNFNNYSDSIQNKQFEVERLKDGVKIVYTFGDSSKGLESIPSRISKERFETKILSKLDSSDQRQITKRFKYVEDQDVYERWDAAMTGFALLKVIELLDKAGYTTEDLAFDNQENGVSSDEASEKVAFTVPLEYRLDGDNLLVTVATEEIRQPETFQLHKLSVLEYFGAADQSDQGYLFVPDGSGSLIYLNNGKLAQETYSAPVYGRNLSTNLKESVQLAEAIRLPVFGMKRNDRSFIAIIEQGDAVASIEADIAGRLHSYNTVNGVFTTISKDEVTLSGGWKEQDIPVFQSRMNQGNLSIRYGFLKGSEANYAGMARYYQTYLIRNKGLKQIDGQGDVPFFLELIGSIPKQKSLLGIPYQALEPLTTFSEAQTILQELQMKGIDNIKLRYTGWFNGGILHKVPTSIEPDKKLGGEKGLRNLAKFAENNGISLYPDVSFQRVYRVSKDFKASRDAAREISRKPAKLYSYNPASFLKDSDLSSAYVLSPHKLPDYVEEFANGYESYPIEGLSLRDLGDELSSDFRNNRFIDRQQAAAIVEEQIKKLSDRSTDMLISGGHAFALPYADNIVNIPMTDSGFNLTDESVPFLQIVMHGYSDYAGEPVNVGEDQNPRIHLLKALETGSSLYFQWIYRDQSEVKETEFDRLYSTNYRLWMDDARDMYGEVNRVLQNVRALRITGHERLGDGVFRTTYEDGTAISVNYGSQAVTVDGMTIEAESYQVGGE
jgi:hypothetical protein